MSPDLAVTLIFYGASALALAAGIVIGSHLRQPIRLRRRRSGNPQYIPAPSEGPLSADRVQLEEDDIRGVLGKMGHSTEEAARIAREIASKGNSVLRTIGGGERP